MSAAGRIYFVQAVSGGNIKIGFAKDVWARLKGLQIGAPEKLRCLLHIAGTMDEEFEFHAQFARHRVAGEWFTDCDDIQALIDRLKQHPTAETKVSPPEKLSRHDAGRDRMAEWERALFRHFAEEAFGKVHTVKRLADAARISPAGAKNLLLGKNDPNFETLTVLFRAAPLMFSWLMLVVVARRMAERLGCAEEETLPILGEHSDLIPAMFLCKDNEASAGATDALWSMARGPVHAETLIYLNEFTNKTLASHFKTARAA